MDKDVPSSNDNGSSSKRPKEKLSDHARNPSGSSAHGSNFDLPYIKALARSDNRSLAESEEEEEMKEGERRERDRARQERNSNAREKAADPR